MTPTVKESDVEKTITDQLAKQGTEPDKVDCPDDLKGKVGETMKCSITLAGESFDVELKVTSVKDNTVNFDINPIQ